MAKRRGRPPSKPKNEASIKVNIDQAPQVDLDETPESRHRKKIAAEDRAAAKDYKTKEKWYKLNGYKLSLCRRKANGNVVSVLVGNIKKQKECAVYYKKLQKSGELIL